MNKDTEYEKFTQELYQQLVNVQGITIEVLHNVELEGKSGQKHQIDVYWEYEIAGIKHKVAIECKNYNSKVSIGKIRDFFGVLSDLNNVNGIMATKIGYQSGAKQFADHYGINLKELRFPNDKDWKGRIKTIDIAIQMVIPDIKQRIPLFDNDWLKANIALQKKQITYSLTGLTNEMIIYNEKGEKITDFFELDNKVPCLDKIDKKNLEHIFPFENAFFDVTGLGRLKIAGIKYIYDINIITDKLIIDALETTKAILKDAISGEIFFFDNKGKVK
ncbi:MAG: restriction endonuclease [Prevotellaceae bacterium]|jgi:hypothetical protein|nr:restriction endonuclease [Prevotellaceae bacterium]